MADSGVATIKVDLDMEPFKGIVHAAVEVLNITEVTPNLPDAAVLGCWRVGVVAGRSRNHHDDRAG